MVLHLPSLIFIKTSVFLLVKQKLILSDFFVLTATQVVRSVLFLQTKLLVLSVLLQIFFIWENARLLVLMDFLVILLLEFVTLVQQIVLSVLGLLISNALSVILLLLF